MSFYRLLEPVLRGLLDDQPEGVRAKIAAIYGVLLAANVVAWVWAAIAFRHHPVLVGTAFLAYSFGLRHAVDADHIAAIDNVTRKLMQEGKRPVAVGLMFSLGHSTVVVAGSVAIAATAVALQHRFESFRSAGAVVGTLVSAFFLLVIAALNLVVLVSIWRTFVQVRQGEPYIAEDFDLLLGKRGFLGRLFRPAFALIRRSWHMYPLGLLFGLGFDTATEIGLLGISATEAAKGLSLWSILVFPVLFTAGMTLVDTTDNILMLKAYGWAFVKPVRKLYYNLTITFVSVVVALGVGGIEALGLIEDQFHFSGGTWGFVARLNEHFGLLGYCIIAIFVLSWLISAAAYKWMNLDNHALQAKQVIEDEIRAQ
ncbi:MAG TPA: HoxN/HupN/NixA family nickel/cobalt transporter [Acidobacteriaceae bacterium]|nr:HoxN/HupN/NixA family nickel/cobalt transporter [Acidobacteriaceae bacterium]